MQIKIEGAEQLRSLSRDLKRQGEYGQGLRKKLRRNIQIAAEPMKADVKAAALAIPSKGQSSGLQNRAGLRNTLAKAVKLSIRTVGKNVSVRLVSSAAVMEKAGYYASLSAYMEGVAGRPWRHRIFGEWVTGQGDQEAHPYFYDTANKHLPEVQAAIQAALDETALAIERRI
jgi:hypothetical protein